MNQLEHGTNPEKSLMLKKSSHSLLLPETSQSSLLDRLDKDSMSRKSTKTPHAEGESDEDGEIQFNLTNADASATRASIDSEMAGISRQMRSASVDTTQSTPSVGNPSMSSGPSSPIKSAFNLVYSNESLMSISGSRLGMAMQPVPESIIEEEGGDDPCDGLQSRQKSIKKSQWSSLPMLSDTGHRESDASAKGLEQRKPTIARQKPSPFAKLKSVGFFLIPGEYLPAYNNTAPKEFLDLLKLSSLEDIQNSSMQDQDMVKAVIWISPPPNPVFEKNALGKLEVKKGNLFSLVGLLLSQETVTDQDYLIDFLRTYRYFSHPLDLARTLALRYLEIVHQQVLVKNGTVQGKSQAEWENFTQLRVLNVLKKWITDFPEDFSECAELRTFLDLFLRTYVKEHPKFGIFSVGILDKLLELSGKEKESKEPPLTSRTNTISSRNSTHSRQGSLLSLQQVRHRTQSAAVTRKEEEKAKHANPFSLLKDAKVLKANKRWSSQNALPKSPIRDLSATFFGTFNPLSEVANVDSHQRNGSISASINSDAAPSVNTEDSQVSLKILDFDPDDVAKCLCILEQQQFATIPLHEFFNQRWNDKNNKELLAPSIVGFIKWFNHVAAAVATDVVRTPRLKERISVLKRWIYTAHKCLQFANYNTCFEIVAGLNLGPVSRLKQTWKTLPKKYLDVWQSLNNVVSSESSYKEYRNSLATMKEKIGDIPMIPYIGVSLSDLTFAEDGNETVLSESAPQPSLGGSTGRSLFGFLKEKSKEQSLSNLVELNTLPTVNFPKLKLISNLLGTILTFQRAPGYAFAPVPTVEEWILNYFVPVDDIEMYNLSRICEPRAALSVHV